MDLLFFAQMKLGFIQQFYEAASAPFRETMRKIHAQEPPFEVPEYEEPDGGEPPFVAEYTDAQDCLSVLGHAALSLVCSVLNKHLSAFLMERGMKLPPGKGAWLTRYRDFYRAIGIDWDAGPVPFADLEQMVLARNDIQHEVDLLTVYVNRSEEHQRRYPNSPYQDQLGFGYVEVTAETLAAACDKISMFVQFLDAVSTNQQHGSTIDGNGSPDCSGSGVPHR